MQRWVAFLIAVTLAGLIVAATTRLSSPSIQRVPCDVQNVFGNQREVVDILGHWLWRNLLLLAGLVVLTTFAAFYLQLFQFSVGGAASWARLVLCLALGCLAGWLLVNVAATWGQRQTGSCLADALRVPAAVYRMTFSDSLPLLGPALMRAEAWRAALAIDMSVLVLLSSIGGVLLYRLAWRLRRF